MTPERFQQISDLFDSIRDLPPPERSDRLDDACREDPDLRAAVQDLLDHHEDAPGFLESAPPAPPADPMPERIGVYRIERLLGEGGMGRVFLAKQEEPIRRSVALKLIKLGMDTREVVARFATERQALAIMDHPNIARVFDAGATDRGRPYFVMEYVDGEPLLAYCDQHRLSVRERLDLFIAVCRAVQYAHQKGVIHRDLKPSNVLVTTADGAPEPKLIDFGIAKATGGSFAGHTLQTDAAQIIGTPAYMSPEQAKQGAATIDTRTDVYSLGVILYELLAGVTPLDGDRLRSASLPEIQQWIAEHDPPRLSTRIGEIPEAIAACRGLDREALRRAVTGDLEWMAAKALARQPDDRYDGAATFADDVERHLANHPILARPPTRSDFIGKFARRHRGALTAAGFAVLAIIASISAALYGSSRARAAEEVARIDARRARDAETAERVERREAEVQSARANAVLQLVGRMFAAADPKHIKGRDYTVEQLLDDYGDSFWSSLAGQPLVEASLRATFGMSYEGLGRFEKSERHFRRAHELLLDAYGPETPETAAAKLALGWTLQLKGDTDRAAPILESVLPELEAIHPDGHLHVAFARHNLGTVRRMQTRYREAFALQESALELLDRLDERDPSNRANILVELGHCNFKLEQFAEARKHYQDALELLDNEAHPTYPTTLARIGESQCAEGNGREGIATIRRAISILRSQRGDEHPGMMPMLLDLGRALRSASRYGEAKKVLKRVTANEASDNALRLQALHELAAIEMEFGRYEQAVELMIEARDNPGIAKIPWLRAQVDATLGIAFSFLGRDREAIPLLEGAIDFRTSAYGPDDERTLTIQSNLASVLYESGQLTKGIRVLEDVVSRAKRPDGTPTNLGLAALNNLGTLYFHAKDPRAAETNRLVLNTRLERLGPLHVDTLRSRVNYGDAVAAGGDRTRSIEILRAAVDGCRKKLDPTHPVHWAALNSLGRKLQSAGEREEAGRLLEQCAEIRERSFGPKDPRTQLAWLSVAELHRLNKDLVAGITLAERILELTRSLPPEKRGALHHGLFLLGGLYLDAGRAGDALPLLRECVKLRAKNRTPLHERAFTENRLGAALAANGLDAEAEVALTRSFRALLDDAVAPRQMIVVARKRVVRFYRERGDRVNADKWQNAPPKPAKEAR